MPLFNAVLAVLLMTGCSAPMQLQSSSATCHARHANRADPQAWLPDPRCTPGSVNPAVTIGMLCPVAHTKQWRPPTSYTNSLKHTQLGQYDYVDGDGDHPQSSSSTEEDHLISLQLGGSPRNPTNLWPEPHASPNEKDAVEQVAHEALCAGKLTLPQVQQGIATDWYAFGKRLGTRMSSSGQLGTEGQ